MWRFYYWYILGAIWIAYESKTSYNNEEAQFFLNFIRNRCKYSTGDFLLSCFGKKMLFLDGFQVNQAHHDACFCCEGAFSFPTKEAANMFHLCLDYCSEWNILEFVNMKTAFLQQPISPTPLQKTLLPHSAQQREILELKQFGFKERFIMSHRPIISHELKKQWWNHFRME